MRLAEFVCTVLDLTNIIFLAIDKLFTSSRVVSCWTKPMVSLCLWLADLTNVALIEGQLS